MAFGTLVKDQIGIPIAQGYLPDVGFIGAQSSPLTNTDGSSNQSAAMVMADQIQVNLLQGLGFIATTGLFATATNPSLTMGMSYFNGSGSGKNVYIYSIKWSAAEATTGLQLRLTTSDPAYGHAITPANLQASGGPASVASVTSAANAATASISTPGTQIEVAFVAGEGVYEFLPRDMGIFLPAGAANGIAVYGVVVTAAKNWAATIRAIEF